MEDSGPEQDARRRLQMWKANTSNLVLGAMESGQEPFIGPEVFRDVSAKDLCNVMKPFSSSGGKQLTRELCTIIDEALELDMLVSRQAAEVLWLWPGTSKELRFDEGSMELDREDQRSAADGDDGNGWLVTALGVAKRGKSTGEDFDSKIVLLKTEISRKPDPRAQGKGEGPAISTLRWIGQTMGIKPND